MLVVPLAGVSQYYWNRFEAEGLEAATATAEAAKVSSSSDPLGLKCVKSVLSLRLPLLLLVLLNGLLKGMPRRTAGKYFDSCLSPRRHLLAKEEEEERRRRNAGPQLQFTRGGNATSHERTIWTRFPLFARGCQFSPISI